QAIAAYPGTQAVARVPTGDSVLIKQYLDVGVQTLLVPMVDTPEQAAQLVRACRYPQDDGQGGIRGMAGARASRWGRFPNYAKEANAQVCLLVQAETRAALEQLDAIAATPGVDGVFIGPADLSASMGHVGNPGHPEVQAAIEDGIARILRAGKAPGILTSDEAQARHYLALGAVFVAVGLDTQILMRQTTDLAARFKGLDATPAPAKGAVY
ncbi:aldolase/citrate lyase family protein, partial [Hydrogenophaga sp.]|uniref:aldolase/citrate lyase family protein n=1 Tax=Hydrogenophaga sp. TaxID=1904254 RepID=UPI002723771D